MWYVVYKIVGRKISRGGRATEKRPKNSKKVRKIALLSLFQGGRGNGKKTEIAKNTEK